MARLLFVTDVLIDHLQGRKRLPDSADGAYSSISRAELYSGRGADESLIDELLDPFEEVAVNRAVAEEAGRVRRSTGVKLPDALVAASAIITNRRLVTRNVRDFRKIQALRILGS